jgi:hypothetical protein
MANRLSVTVLFISPPPAIEQQGDESFERPAEANLAGKRHGEEY